MFHKVTFDQFYSCKLGYDDCQYYLHFLVSLVSTIAAIRVGLMLAPGGEFAFVAFGEAVNQVICAIFL